MFLVLGNSRDSSFELLPVLVLLTCLPWIPVSTGGALSGLQEGITSRDAGSGKGCCDVTGDRRNPTWPQEGGKDVWVS